MGKYGIGQPVLRFEDPRLLQGRGRYIHDVNLPGQAYAVFLRSPHAHAKIVSVDTAAAKALPGVVAIFTGADYAADGLGMPKVSMPRKRPDGSPMFAPARPALCVDRVRYVGDPVATVVAETLPQAMDAAERITVAYDPLPSVTATAEATLPGAPAVWDECPDNISNFIERGNKAATDAAFAKAARIVRRRYVITRVHAQYIEPRGALAVHDPTEDRLTLYADVQYPHRVRQMLAQSVFRVPESKVRVISGDVGGGSAPRAGNMSSIASRCGRRASWGARSNGFASVQKPSWLTNMVATTLGTSNWRSTPTTSSSACGCICWPILARMSAPIATCCRPSG